MKRIAFLPLVFFLIGCGPGFVKTQTPTPTVTPIVTPVPAQYDPAALVDAVINGLDTLQVDKVIEGAAGAQTADTQTAHTSDLGQLVQDIGPLILPCTFGIFMLAVVALALGALWYLRQAKDGQELTNLTLALARLEELFRAAGVDVSEVKK